MVFARGKISTKPNGFREKDWLLVKGTISTKKSALLNITSLFSLFVANNGYIRKIMVLGKTLLDNKERSSKAV